MYILGHCVFRMFQVYIRLVSNFQTYNNCIRQSQVTSMYIQEELTLVKTTKVLVSWVESPDKIYVTKVGQQSDRLKKLLNELKEHYETITLPKKIEDPIPGLPCAVRLEDNLWYRAEIVEVIENNNAKKKIKVYCIDLGCIVSLDFPSKLNSIQEIPYAYTLLNAQAIRISLMYVTPTETEKWSSQAFLILRSALLTKKVSVYPKIKKRNGHYLGCIISDGLDISKLLKSSGCAKEYMQHLKNSQYKIPHIKQRKTRYNRKYEEKKRILKVNTDNGNKLEDESIISDNLYDYSCNTVDITMDNSSSSSTPVQSEKHPFMIEILVHQWESPDCIYVSQTSREDSMKKLIWAIQKFYNKYHSEPRNNWDVNDTCIVYSAKDKSYFRAYILDIQSPKEVLVQFYDKAFKEIVTLKDIQVLHPTFAKEAAYCFKVKLAGIMPCGDKPDSWPSLTITEFQKLMRENYRRKFYISKPVQEEMRDGVIPVELWVRQVITPGPFEPDVIQINSVNRMLVDKGVVLPIRDYFAKADATLATELENHLKDNHQLALSKEEAKWFNNFLLSRTKKNVESERSDDDKLCDNLSINALTDSLIANCTIKDWAEISNAAITSWLPPNTIEEDEFYAIPSYVDQQCAIYLRPHNANKQLQFIQRELKNHYKNVSKINTIQWKEGDICIARYHLDNQWYRGKIVKNFENKLMVQYVDYGNIEECDLEDVTDNVRLGHIPIQCTKCVIGGLKSTTSNGKWRTCDLDQIHALLVDRVCKVNILRRLQTHLVISISLLEPKICDFSSFIIKYYNMRAAIEKIDWNSSMYCESETINNSVFVAKDDSVNTVPTGSLKDEEGTEEFDTSKRNSSGTYVQDTSNEIVISGNLESSKLQLIESIDAKESDFEIASIDFHTLDLGNRNLICSTPQEVIEDVFDMYNYLTIPRNTKYIELKLIFNLDATTAIAQIAANNNDIFSKKLNKTYLQFKAMMSELQASASSQPLLQRFDKCTPCVAKFTDDLWYRCAIVDCEKEEDTQYLNVNLYYIDYGNMSQTQVNLLSTTDGLRVSKDEWLQLPAMCLTCKFWHLEFVGTDRTALATRLNELYNNKVIAEIKENNGSNNELVVQAYKDTTCRELFFAELIEEGFYRFNNPEIDNEIKTIEISKTSIDEMN
ncbi:RING finger protein 17-like isoform X2 [Pseudomyrmex gracilis]|uniref:RING finger protein 17-like isoform X2 n=1 Tax=Pseudomyrmex gracilis TaxID=219809 RepID=UPI000995872C|nr:RING finger protein 17-like isoform X2 [Pseudomyrmex gracilis]